MHWHDIDLDDFNLDVNPLWFVLVWVIDIGAVKGDFQLGHVQQMIRL